MCVGFALLPKILIAAHKSHHIHTALVLLCALLNTAAEPELIWVVNSSLRERLPSSMGVINNRLCLCSRNWATIVHERVLRLPVGYFVHSEPLRQSVDVLPQRGSWLQESFQGCVCNEL